jgi:hypothetical protein
MGRALVKINLVKSPEISGTRRARPREDVFFWFLLDFARPDMVPGIFFFWFWDLGGGGDWYRPGRAWAAIGFASRPRCCH